MRFNSLQSALDTLRTDNTLTSLDLSHTIISDADAQAIADALKKNKNLTSINLCGNRRNRISDTGIQAIIGALEENETLTSIDLSHMIISDANAKAIADALKKIRPLLR